jgi:hypothetical protein
VNVALVRRVRQFYCHTFILRRQYAASHERLAAPAPASFILRKVISFGLQKILKGRQWSSAVLITLHILKRVHSWRCYASSAANGVHGASEHIYIKAFVFTEPMPIFRSPLTSSLDDTLHCRHFTALAFFSRSRTNRFDLPNVEACRAHDLISRSRELGKYYLEILLFFSADLPSSASEIVE